MEAPQGWNMHGFLPLLRHGLHAEQLLHTEVLEDLKHEVWREVPYDVER